MIPLKSLCSQRPRLNGMWERAAVAAVAAAMGTRWAGGQKKLGQVDSKMGALCAGDACQR